MNKAMLGFVLLLSYPLAAQQQKNVESKIDNVTVFLNKAQVEREARTHVEAGKTDLIVTGLPSSLDAQSIQVAGKGNFIILGIAHQQNYLNELNVPKMLRSLKDSLEYLQRQATLEQAQKEILNKEEQMLLSNQKIGGANQNLTVAELKGMADFYRQRLGEIAVSNLKQGDKIRKINERIVKLQRQINEQNELYARNTSEIVISVSADAAATVALDVRYVVANAGWQPVYDLRAVDTKSPVQLRYKANVYQSTGEDWKSVKLKLSTANPNLGGLKPELYTWYLDLERPEPKYSYQPMKYKDARSAAPAAAMEKMEEEVAMDAASAGTTADFVNTLQTTLNTVFDIALPYTVASSSKPTVVDIKNHELKSDYEYSVAPKLDADAFLMARVTGWEEFSLLPGEANVFFEGTFVAKTFIDPSSIKDTLSVSLGRDKRIVVKREKLKDFSSRKAIGSNQRDSYAYEISVRNTKAEPVKIIVEDQIPVSQNSQIEVTTTDAGGANVNSTTGKLVWEMNLQPNQAKKVVYKFEVKYPKGRTIPMLY
ncbi:MAG TPA: DUF4139 domain-containing protein [Ohtaekwangia sp.]|uniref:DUF4139 domain-containing protein n=1 Tax=Ohtaekwangia sp. TaxID=2066019 RepID=UPI002F921229